MIHEGKFRRRLEDEMERPKLEIVLYAIIIAASKFVQNAIIPVDHTAVLRRRVICTAMDTLAPESLQALIILAFTDVCLYLHSLSLIVR